jgi:hypothetical protein
MEYSMEYSSKFTPDFFFSNWTFIWFLLFITLQKYKIANPSVSLLFCLIFNSIQYIISSVYVFKNLNTISRDNFINSVIIFPIIQVFLKILPLYTLYKYKLFKISKNETRSMIYLLIVYFIYIYLFKREQTQLIYNKIVKEKRYIISDEPAPFTVIIRNIFN